MYHSVLKYIRRSRSDEGVDSKRQQRCNSLKLGNSSPILRIRKSRAVSGSKFLPFCAAIGIDNLNSPLRLLVFQAFYDFTIPLHISVMLNFSSNVPQFNAV